MEMVLDYKQQQLVLEEIKLDQLQMIQKFDGSTWTATVNNEYI
jgi:hypothetical protein